MNRKFSLPSFRNARIHFLFFTLSVLCVLCGESSAQDFKTAHDGVEYAQVDHKIGSDPVKINLLRLDLKKVRLDVHHAMDAAIGTEKTSSIATRHGAVAAINAGFFRLDTSIFAGDAVSALMIDGDTYSDMPTERIALFIVNAPEKLGTDDTGVHIKKLAPRFEIKIGKTNLTLSGLNRERKENEIVLYTPKFHRTTLTDSSGVEVIVRKGKIVSILNGVGSSFIPFDGYVISATGEGRDRLLGKARIGARTHSLTIFTEEFSNRTRGHPIYDTSTLWALADDIVAGVPQLIKDGKIDITWEQEKSSKAFVETRHPRTAVAKLKDGKFLMITVDGRQPGVSVGMNLYELADYLLSIGAVDAMNLDGGGSTTMFLDGKVVNKPSDKEGERKVSDAILVTLRKGKLK